MTNDDLKLMRHILGSIDLYDVDETLNDAELLARAGDVEIFYKKYFDKQLKQMIQEQLEFIGKEVQPEQLAFARGTINGFSLIREWFKDQLGLSLSRNDKESGTEAGGSGLPIL
jgi:hypothetical protein